MTQIIIKTHHVDISPSIKEYVDKKLSKLDQFFDKIQEIQVDLDVETFPNEEDRQIVSATVMVPGSALIARESSKDLYASVDGMVDKLQRQLKKYKDKLRLKNRKQAMKTKRDIQKISLNIVGDVEQETSNDDPANFYVKKPMHPEDAAMILEGKEQSFLVFRNAANEKINVIYVTDDGNFGLIET
ncbi:MAG: ribosome hibernation-promoting factor, HPF/YfiA family [Candidatus Marinamargulisbacteria bacterium]